MEYTQSFCECETRLPAYSGFSSLMLVPHQPSKSPLCPLVVLLFIYVSSPIQTRRLTLQLYGVTTQ